MAEFSEAIKLDEIEPPSGDLVQNYGVIHNDMSSSLLSGSRNRRSLALDLKRPEAIRSWRRGSSHPAACMPLEEQLKRRKKAKAKRQSEFGFRT